MKIKTIDWRNAHKLLTSRNCNRIARKLGYSSTTLYQIKNKTERAKIATSRFVYEAIETYFEDIFKPIMTETPVPVDALQRWMVDVCPDRIRNQLPVHPSTFYRCKVDLDLLTTLNAKKRKGLEKMARNEAKKWITS